MDMHAPLLLDLPPDLRTALRAQARLHGRSSKAEAQKLLARGLGQHRDPAPAKTPLRADEGSEVGRGPLLAPLRALLAADLSKAQGWDDLQARLSNHGYTFRERGGGLALYCCTTAARICKASDLGWTYSDLMRRFDQPFPGHSHTHLAERVLNRAIPVQPKHHHPNLFPDPGDDENDNLILFEDE